MCSLKMTCRNHYLSCVFPLFNRCLRLCFHKWRASSYLSSIWLIISMNVFKCFLSSLSCEISSLFKCRFLLQSWLGLYRMKKGAAAIAHTLQLETILCIAMSVTPQYLKLLWHWLELAFIGHNKWGCREAAVSNKAHRWRVSADKVFHVQRVSLNWQK